MPLDTQEAPNLTCFEQRHREEQDALQSIARILGGRGDQGATLAHVLEVLERRMGMRRCTLMLLSPDESELIVDTTHAAHPPRAEEARYGVGEGVTGRVLQTGAPAVIPRISEEPAFQNRIHKRGAGAEDASFICVPISVNDAVVGTLSVDLPRMDAASLADRQRFLTIVACLIANQVNARRIARLERQTLEAENLRLRSELGEHFRPENMIGASPAMRAVYQKIYQVAHSDTTVLIRGETGTGKELVASAIHCMSQRADRPFVKVNCAALSENLLESELFGHERGAFTGALMERVGRIEEAESGTLLLDEIGDFSPAIQVKLLRALQEKEYQRVGSNKTHRANVRVVAATNRDLEKAMTEGRFREDLYYRINVFPIFLPPLRERKADILMLANHFAQRHADKMGKDIRRISTTAINILQAYHWPGNIRELENSIEHAVLLATEGVIHGHDLPPTLQMPEGVEPSRMSNQLSLKARIEIMEKDIVMDSLKRHNGNASATARELGITPRMVRYKMRKYNLDNKRYYRK